MSAPAPETPETVELPPQGDAAFSSLMDLLVAAEDSATETASATDAAAPASADGQPAPEGEGAGAAAPVAPAPPAGAPAVTPAPVGEAPATPTSPGTVRDGSAAGAVDAASLAPKWGEISTALENNYAEAFQSSALDEVREEHPRYFEALEKHPRLLVGTEVPSIMGEGMETLRDSADAAEWQEAAKSILVQEVKDRAIRASESGSDMLTTMHAAIELFQNNADLIPGTKGFDRELANRFAEFSKPYETRMEGKLVGYSIPTQPLIDQIRTTVKAERAAKPKTAGAPAPAGKAPAKPKADPPQAGLSAKAGAGSAAEDYSALFGTLGLPNFRI